MQTLGEGMGKIGVFQTDFCIREALKIGNVLKAVLSLVSTLLQRLTDYASLLSAFRGRGLNSGSLDLTDTKISVLGI